MFDKFRCWRTALLFTGNRVHGGDPSGVHCSRLQLRSAPDPQAAPRGSLYPTVLALSPSLSVTEVTATCPVLCHLAISFKRTKKGKAGHRKAILKRLFYIEQTEEGEPSPAGLVVGERPAGDTSEGSSNFGELRHCLACSSASD